MKLTILIFLISSLFLSKATLAQDSVTQTDSINFKLATDTLKKKLKYAGMFLYVIDIQKNGNLELTNKINQEKTIINLLDLNEPKKGKGIGEFGIHIAYCDHKKKDPTCALIFYKGETAQTGFRFSCIEDSELKSIYDLLIKVRAMCIKA